MTLMDSFKNLFSLLRPWQWYKNIIIFVPAIFSTLALNRHLLLLTFIGFISLSLASSGNYVINDILDKEADKKHPEKRNRPLASGAIGVPFALVVALVLFALSFVIAWTLAPLFLALVILFVLLTHAYSIWFKHFVFIDVLLISVNFVLRVIGGILLLDHSATPTPWIIICPFFLALFLAVGKRKSDIALLGKKAAQHKRVLAHYTPELTNNLLTISTTLLIISYTLYAFLSEHRYYLMVSMPFALYLVFYYFSLLDSHPEITRHPERALKDPHVIIGTLLWGIATLAAIYLPILLK